MYKWFPTMKDHTFRLIASVLVFCVRVACGWYAGVDFLHTGKAAAAYLLWSLIIAALVYVAILPRTRSAERHPHQRATDRSK